MSSLCVDDVWSKSVPCSITNVGMCTTTNRKIIQHEQVRSYSFYDCRSWAQTLLQHSSMLHRVPNDSKPFNGAYPQERIRCTLFHALTGAYYGTGCRPATSGAWLQSSQRTDQSFDRFGGVPRGNGFGDADAELLAQRDLARPLRCAPGEAGHMELGLLVRPLQLYSEAVSRVM